MNDCGRIGFLLQNLGVGGAERQALLLARALREGGREVDFLLAEAGGAFEDEARAADFRIHHLGARHSLPKWHPAFWINLAAVVLRVSAIARRRNITLLHSFLFWQDTVAIAARVLSPRIAAAITSRRAVHDFTLGRRRDRVINALNNLVADCVVCNSRGVRGDVLAKEMVRPRRLVVIPNGIDPAPFESVRRSRRPRTKQDAVVAGTVGTMRPVKRHDLFLRALATARESVPGLRGIHVGGDGGSRDDLLALADRLGLRDEHVRFAGEALDPAPWYARMDLFVLTSDSEGFPNVVLEAMACGLPVIATAVHGVEDVLVDGRTGILVPVGDAGAMARAIVRLASDPVEAAAIGRRARRHVLHHFSHKANVARYDTLYRRLGA